MAGFLLSPGITPLLTDLFVAELPLAVGLGLIIGRARGAFLALALNAFALAAIKLATDWFDGGDDIVSLGALVAGLILVGAAARPVVLARLHRAGWIVGGVLLIGIGGLKVASDFYDPFDLLLADLAVVGGFIAIAYGLAGRASLRRWGLPYEVAT